MSVQDRYKRSAKELRAIDARRAFVQSVIQHSTATRTMAACCNSPDRSIPGTFANNVLTAMAMQDDFPEAQRLGRRALNGFPQ